MTKLKNIEVEITFPLRNSSEVINNLKALGLSEEDSEYQKDIYYIPLHRNFLLEKPISDWLRIRETNHGASINFKHWHNQENAQAVSCDEFESKVENIEALKKIFDSLDIKEVVIVEKTRRIWNYKGVELALDQVTDLGSFIEIEAKGDFDTIKDAEKHLYDILKELGAKTGEQDYKGYPHLILEKQGHNFS